MVFLVIFLEEVVAVRRVDITEEPQHMEVVLVVVTVALELLEP